MGVLLSNVVELTDAEEIGIAIDSASGSALHLLGQSNDWFHGNPPGRMKPDMRRGIYQTKVL